MTDPTAREVLEATQRDCGCRIPAPFDEVAEYAMLAFASRSVEEARREERERCARLAVKVQKTFEDQPESDLSFGARFGVKTVGEAISSLPDAPERDGGAA